MLGALPRAGRPASGSRRHRLQESDLRLLHEWVTHLRRHGFRVRTEDLTDLQPIKTRHGVPAELQSCHTALVAGYVVEGHVPADLVERLLRERPRVAGLAVPGMPVGSPGMEVPGMPADRYRVLTFDRSGKTEVFATR